MPLTSEAKKLLAETIRGTKQDPERGLRARLLRAIHDEADRKYRLSVPIDDAGLDEAHRRRRERIEQWIAERTRAAKPKNKIEEKETKVRVLAEAEKEAAATFINRVVVLRQLEALGLSKPAVLTGGWKSKGYREFEGFGRALCSNGTADATEGYGALLQLVFDELAIDLPGLFGNVGLTKLFSIPAAALRDVVETFDDPELVSAWTDEITLGWIYQYWNDPDREALDEKIAPATAWGSGKIEPYEIASKTQMFTERYMVEWLLQNSLGLTWLCMCEKHGWTPDASKVLPTLEARRAAWRKKREAGDVALDDFMPIEGELEEHWKYYVPQPLPKEAIAGAPDSLRAIKLLDPAVGSGHFLVIAFGLLTFLYREEARHRSKAITDREIAESIIECNLHGIDIDPRAVQIAAASLYLKAKSLARDAHPRRMNLAAPILQLGNLTKDDPAVVTLRNELKHEVGIPEALTNKVLEALAGVDYLGSLLKVDSALEDAIRTVELSFHERTERSPGSAISGSLASAKESLLSRLETFLAKHSSSEDLGLRLDGEQLTAGVRFVRMSREGTYDVIVGNPPYQGLSKTSSFGYVAATYPRGKADLYAAFLERGLELVRIGGFSAMVTMQGWMFLSQYEELRRAIIDDNSLRSVCDLMWCAFENMRHATVAMNVVMRGTERAEHSVAIAPTDRAEREESIPALTRKRAAVLAHVGRSEFDPQGFSVIDGEPIVYWWTTEMLARYSAAPKLRELDRVRVGLQTSDNARYVRYVWESSAQPLCEKHEDSALLTWAPYIKGGEGRGWIEPVRFIVNWHRRGLEVKTASLWRHGSIGKRVANEDIYFVHGVAFPLLGSEFRARAHRRPSIIDVMGASVFPRDIWGVVCCLNTTYSKAVLASLNPTIHFTVGDVERLAVYEVLGSAEIGAELDRAFTVHESHRETSIEFRAPGSTSWPYIQQWAQLAVDRDPNETRLPLCQPEHDPPTPEQFISFAIGVALGRFGTNGEGILAAAPDSALPDGILFLSAAGADSLDHAGAAPLCAMWEEHGNAVGAGDDLRTYLRTSFFGYHKKLYEGRPIYFPLSSARKSFVAFVSIHRWKADTLGVLLADHLIPTRRRLDGELEDLRAARANGTNHRQAEERFTRVQRLLEELNEFANKVSEVAERGPQHEDGTVKREADARYVMELDDGVMVNSAALWPLLEHQWKEPKKWWKDLAAAKSKKDYDWSRMAARYFPKRVRSKCKDDPSLAIAHRCFWELHPEKAYAWELRLADEIRVGFTIDEPGSDAARVKFLAEHEGEANEIRAEEMRRRERKAAKDDSDSSPLFDQADGDNVAGESSDD